MSWQTEIQVIREHEKYGEDMRIVYEIISPQYILAAREILFCELREVDPDGTIRTIGFSVDLPEFPEKSDPVRAQAHFLSFVISPHPEGSYVEVMGLVNPRGSIPAWSAPIAANTFAEGYVRLRKKLDSSEA